MSYTVVVTEKLWPEVEKLLREQCKLRMWEGTYPIPREKLLQWLQDADGLFCSGDVQVNDELLDHAPKLKVVVKAAVGYDNIDIEACTRRGIPVGYTPGVLVETTADLAYALLLVAARRLNEGWDQVRAGEWENSKNIPFGVDLYGKTLGIIGMGRIGAAVARRAQASGMRVRYTNRNPRPDEGEMQVEYRPMTDLLASSDFVMVLTPLTAETRGLIGQREFARMKGNAIFINVARGAVVDTDALYNALKKGEIAYAALDVTDPEPLPSGHPLLSLPNIFITPHVGSATRETRVRMGRLAANNLLAGLKGESLPASVNLSDIRENSPKR